MRSVAAVFCALISLTCVLPSHAANFGNRDEAVAMVRHVQDYFARHGAEATFKAINGRAPGFVDRDLYPFVQKIDGSMVVATINPALLGKNLSNTQDQDGKFFNRECVKVVNTPPFHGWVDFRFFNPKTNLVEDKSVWVERLGDNYYVGVGVYKNEQPNENTIGIISGSPTSDDTYLQIAYDLAEVLNDADNLRILPIAGVGGPRNIRDVRYLSGVDIGLTQTSILNSFRRSNLRMGHADDKIEYIAKLFNEEVHLLARPEINSIADLRGRKVNLDVRGSGTSYSMRDLFQTYGIEVVEVSMSQLEALDKLKNGEIAATALIAGKPVRSLSYLNRGDGLHFVPLSYPMQLIGDYLPATLNHDDYPQLVPDGEIVDTVAVGAVMITLDSPRNSDRYRRVEQFVRTFFAKIAEFQRAPHHRKWREVNLAATLPNWTRFPAAQEWFDNEHHEQPRVGVAARSAGTPARPAAAAPAAQSSAALFQDFMKWRQQSAGR